MRESERKRERVCMCECVRETFRNCQPSAGICESAWSAVEYLVLAVDEDTLSLYLSLSLSLSLSQRQAPGIVPKVDLPDERRHVCVCVCV